MMNFKSTTRFSVVIALVLPLMIFTFTMVEAGTATIHRTDDSYSNLQIAINEAMLGDTILLEGTFTGSFKIEGKVLITLQAKDNSECVLDGEGKGRVLEIIGDSAQKPTFVRLVGAMTIKNGYASLTSSNGANGGGILSCYADLGLNGVKITDCIADATGGGIAALYSSLMIEGGIIEYNKAATGGGINALLSSAIINSGAFIRHNSDSGGGGGGILSNSSTIQIANSFIAYNDSKGVGGGLYNSLGSSTRIDTIEELYGIRNNSAAGKGGGVYNDGLVFMGSTVFTSNTSEDFGGGLFNTSSGRAFFTDCQLSFNSAVSGGGIYNAASFTQLILTNTIVSSNQPDDIVGPYRK